MAEQFRINGPLRNSTAVHGYVRAVFPPAELMDNLWKTLFTDTALTGYQY